MNASKKIIPRAFYNRDPVVVAQDLLGKYLVRKINNVFFVGMISETEAYLSEGDSAAHSFKGKTKRNVSLYKDAGHAYVHSMRQYFLLDVVTQGIDIPSSVLIRGIDPIKNINGLINGPGKVCIALSINKQFDGVDMTNPRGELFITYANEDIKHKVTKTLRIGISTAKDMPLRFHISK